MINGTYIGNNFFKRNLFLKHNAVLDISFMASQDFAFNLFSWFLWFFGGLFQQNKRFEFIG